ncbi:MAG: hypothetical protein ACFNLN_06190 [Treponema socranskii subsp. buccale]
MLGTPPLINALDLRIGYEERGSGEDEIERMAGEFASNECGDRSLKEAVNKFKSAYVRKSLEETAWNKTKAGKILGIQRTYVSRLLNDLRDREEESEEM